ncbi:MAG TPA: GrpB family protein [Stellaceae bacterium]|nr:GrpB family protein [Stellaceae bacterium]
MERYGAGQIVVAEYDPLWPVMFEQERVRLVSALGPMVLVIEHVGSTAVPGLAAKPIIDLLVGVESLAAARSRAIEPLVALGYAYLPEYASWLPDELFFRKGVPWTHHVHIMEPSGPRWRNRLLFRDYLRAHPEAAQAYATLKRNLAAVLKDDIAAYRGAKDDFVAEVMARAREDSGLDR